MHYWLLITFSFFGLSIFNTADLFLVWFTAGCLSLIMFVVEFLAEDN